MKFLIEGIRDRDEEAEKVSLVYDNMTSELAYEDGTPVDVHPVAPMDFSGRAPALAFSPDNPARKTSISRLKVQLGFSCNYSCGYCSQKFVPHAQAGSASRVKKFLDGLDGWLTSPPSRIEFWGGEPLVYWKSMKPLAEALSERFPHAQLSMITNGSLLTREINAWLDALGFMVAVSHDGPGQAVRGPDPLDDPEQREVILDLARHLLPKGKFSFNSVLSKGNTSRAAIGRFFEDLLGADRPFMIGEGGLAMVFDDDGKAATSLTEAERAAFRLESFYHATSPEGGRFWAVKSRVTEWINSIGNRRPAEVLGQGCSMGNPDVVAVDLNGNVITCQNVTASARTDEGRSHRIGHVSNLPEVALNTGWHWSTRDNCSRCPVVQACRGSCLFLSGDRFEQTCRNAYDEHLPLFAAAIYLMTGVIPFAVLAEDGSTKPERALMWDVAEEPR